MIESLDLSVPADLPIAAEAERQRRLHELLLEYSKQLVFNLDDLGIGIFTRTE